MEIIGKLNNWEEAARHIAQEEGVDPDLFASLVKHESNFNPRATSPKKAFGLAQLMPDTAQYLGVDPRDPLDNLRGGARYFREQMNTFGNDPALGVAAYNAGPGAVEKYGGIPPFRETINHVNKVMRDAYAQRKQASAPMPEELESGMTILGPAPAPDTGGWLPSLSDLGQIGTGLKEELKQYLPRYGSFISGAYDSTYPEEYKKWQDYIGPPSPTPESWWGQVMRGVGQAGGMIPELAIMSKLLGPFMGSGTDILSRVARSAIPFSAASLADPEAGLSDLGQSAALGAGLGAVPPWWGRLARVPTAAGIGGGMGLLTGQTPEEASKGAAVLGILSALHGRVPRPGRVGVEPDMQAREPDRILRLPEPYTDAESYPSGTGMPPAPERPLLPSTGGLLGLPEYVPDFTMPQEVVRRPRGGYQAVVPPGQFPEVWERGRGQAVMTPETYMGRVLRAGEGLPDTTGLRTGPSLGAQLPVEMGRRTGVPEVTAPVAPETPVAEPTPPTPAVKEPEGPAGAKAQPTELLKLAEENVKRGKAAVQPLNPQVVLKTKPVGPEEARYANILKKEAPELYDLSYKYWEVYDEIGKLEAEVERLTHDRYSVRPEYYRSQFEEPNELIYKAMEEVEAAKQRLKDIDNTFYKKAQELTEYPGLGEKKEDISFSLKMGFSLEDIKSAYHTIKDPLKKLFSIQKGKTEIEVPDISRALIDNKAITPKMVEKFRMTARKHGVGEDAIARAEKTFEEFNRIRKVGPYIVLPELGKGTKSVVLREGVLNTPAAEGLRRKRLDKYYRGIKLGESPVDVGALVPGGAERLGIPREIVGREPHAFLSFPSTEPALRSQRPDDFHYPVVITGNSHLTNFVRPHPSWDDNIKVVRVKLVYRGVDAVNNAVARAINYANEVDAHILVTHQRFQKAYRLAQYTDIIPTDPKDPEFDKYWAKNPSPPPKNRKNLPSYVPYNPKQAAIRAFRNAGWKSHRDIYGEGGQSWYWPKSKELDPKILSQIDPNTEVEYCDLLNKGCPSCRNCQKLIYPKEAGAPMWGITDEPFCEMGCPDCFVRQGQSGIGGRKGISVARNFKLIGYGEKELGDQFPSTINILQRVNRRAIESDPDFVSKFFFKTPEEQAEIISSLAINERITPKEMAESLNEIRNQGKASATIGSLRTGLNLEDLKFLGRKFADLGDWSKKLFEADWKSKFKGKESRLGRGTGNIKDNRISNQEWSAWRKYWDLPQWSMKDFGKKFWSPLVTNARLKYFNNLKNPWYRAAAPIFDIPKDKLGALRDLLIKADQISRRGLEQGGIGMRERIDAAINNLKANEDPAVVQAAEAWWSTGKRIWDKLDKSFTKMGFAEEDIAMLRREMGYVPYYFPHMRFGKHIVIVKQGGKTIHAEGATNLLSRNRLVADLKERFPKAEVKPFETKGAAEEIFFGLNDVHAAQMAKMALKRAGKLTPETEAQVLQAMSDSFKERGFGRQFIKQKNIPGFETDDFQRVIANYINGAAGFISKMEAAPEYLRSLYEIDPKQDPHLYSFAENYVRHALKNTTRMDEVAGKIRGGLFMYYLGWNIKSAALNLTQNITTGAPVLSTITNRPTRKLFKAQKDLIREGKAFWDLARGDETSFKHLDPKEAKALRQAFENGWLDDIYTEELLGRIGSQASKGMDKFTGSARYLFGNAETYNRATMFLAAFRELTKQGKSFEEAMKTSNELVLTSHFPYGKYDVPEWARGPIARTAYTFKAFSHNYVLMLKHLAKENPAAFGRAIRNLGLLGGVKAIPLVGAAFGIYKALTGKDLFLEAFDDKENNLAYIGSRYGIPGFAGLDMSGSLDVRFLGDYENFGEFAKQLTGALGGVIGDTVDAADYYRRGDYYRMAEKLSPTAARNVLQAYRKATEGVVTKRGQEVVGAHGEPLKLTPGEAIRKGMGFQSPRTTTQREITDYMYDLQQYQREKADRWATQAMNAIRNNDRDALVGIFEEVNNYNQKAMQRGEPPIDLDNYIERRSRQKLPVPQKWLPKAQQLY